MPLKRAPDVVAGRCTNPEYIETSERQYECASMETVEEEEFSVPEDVVTIPLDDRNWNPYLVEEDNEKGMGDSEGDIEDNPWDSLPTTAYEDKLKEVLRNLCLAEPKTVIDASKEFVRLLRGSSGEEILRYYVQASPSCQELWDAWKLQREKSALTRVWSLICAILEHPGGKEPLIESGESRGRNFVIDPAAKSRHLIRKRLDSFARGIVEDKLDDVYAALSGKETSRRNGALLLMAAVVRRGPGFAYEVVRKIDFSIKAFVDLAETKPNKVGTKANNEEKKKRLSTRPAFIEFAMAFLQASDPKALRWVLQKKEIYAGVLHGLSGDDVKTVVFVLYTLQKKVLSTDSLVPPSLQSVLFGDVTLEQLTDISGNPDAGDAAEVAHRTLMMVCTDPSHGLMPESRDNLIKPVHLAGRDTLKGNPGRLLRLMLRLRPMEVECHKDLLLAIVDGRPSLTASYMDSFPYNLEPRPSPHWFSAILLASDLVSAVKLDACLFSSVPLWVEPPNMDSSPIQIILKCIFPSSFTRLVINRGLLHSNILVRHGSLRILLEALKSIHGMINAINIKFESMGKKQHASRMNCRLPSQAKNSEVLPKITGFPGADAFSNIVEYFSMPSLTNTNTEGLLLQQWLSLRQGLQDEFRAMLPDPQVLLKLLSSLTFSQSFTSKLLKRKKIISASHETSEAVKKFKSRSSSDDVDIFINGIASEVTVSQSGDCGIADDTCHKEDSDEMQNAAMIARMWCLHDLPLLGDDSWTIETYFHCKLLDAITFYMRIIPDSMLDGSYDFFKILPSDPMMLNTCQVQSLLPLLLEYIQQCLGSRTATKGHELIYKHLQPLIKLMLYSPIQGIRNQAGVLAREAMLSTGAFDLNMSEIESWFVSLPGYVGVSSSAGSSLSETFVNMAEVVVPFFCDAVSTVGNNLHKYLSQLRENICSFKCSEDTTPNFGPLLICILQKCMRVLESDTKTFKLFERYMISLYVGNSLKLLLQIQLGSGLLSSVIISILNKKFINHPSLNVDSHKLHCEWRPLKNLLWFAESMKSQDACMLKPLAWKPMNGHSGSLSKTVCKVLEMVREGHDGPFVKVAAALCSSLLCAEPEDLVHNFPSLIVVFQSLFRDGFEFLFPMFSIEHDLLAQIFRQWPDLFSSARKIIASVAVDNDRKDNDALLGNNLKTSYDDCVPIFDMSDELVASVFSLFLQCMPLCVLLPTIICFGDSRPLDDAEILGLLKSKISVTSGVNVVLLLRFILFWLHRIELYYRTAPSSHLEERIKLCFLLVEDMLIHALTSTLDPEYSQSGQAAINTLFIEEVVDIIFHHPAVTMFLLHPRCISKDQKESAGDSFKDFLCSSEQYVSPIDLCVLCLLRNIADYISKANVGSACGVHDIHKSVKKACRNLLQHVLSVFMEDFEWCVIANRNQVPCFGSWYILSNSLRYISPFVLLETVNWIFCKMELHSTNTLEGFSPISVGMYMAEAAFNMLPCYLVRGIKTECTCNLFWENLNESLDIVLIEKIYSRVLGFSMTHQMDNADLCLLEAVSAAQIINRTAQPQAAHLPLSIAMLRMIIESPLEVVVHCIHKVNKVKSKLLLLIAEMSLRHLNYCGTIFLSMLNKDLLGVDNLIGLKQIGKEQHSVLSTEDKIMLLPIVHLYFSSSSNLDKEHTKSIIEFYLMVLLNGFSNWENFVTSSMFLIDPIEVSFTSTDELLHFLSCSVLGKSVHMFRYYIHGSLHNKKQRKSLFNSLLTSLAVHDELLICDVNEVFLCSHEQLFNLVNRVVAKLSLLRMLLCPESIALHVSLVEEDEGSNEMLTGRKISSKAKLKPKSYFRLMACLVATLDKIVQRCPLSLICFSSQNNDHCYLFARFLEVTILRNLVELSAELDSNPVLLRCLTFLEPFTRSSLVHRFEDPVTLRAMRTILLLFSRCTFNFNDILKHLLAHSLLVPTIMWSESNSDPSFHCSRKHLSLKSTSNILQFLVFPESTENAFNEEMNTETHILDVHPDIYQRKLEVVKLLRVLVLLKAQNIHVDASEEVIFNSRDLLSLLLSGYGATMSEIDLEVCHLMHEIEFLECSDGSQIAAMDYLWGSSASKVRKEQILDKLLSVDEVGGYEADEEYHRRAFKENLAVDSRLSLMTVLNFPYNRNAWTQPASLKKLWHDTITDISSTSCGERKVTSYDPDFILRFSIHGLSRDFFEPVEFAQLGLLAIAFVSIASTDEGVRKLGYDVVGKFKKSLEGRQTGKVGLSLRLLLAYLQNGIVEPWQKIPSVIAVFAAEASLILINSEENHYLVINQFLTRFSKVNLESVPLFHTLLGSGTIHFQRDRDWILRLSYVGLNLLDDALIFRRNFLLERLLSFHASALVNHELRILVLQIVKKAAKLPPLVQHLVKHCGLISWLSSLFASCAIKLYEEQSRLVYSELVTIFEVLIAILSDGRITLWLSKIALEQLSELSSQIHSLFVHGLDSLKEHVQLVNFSLETLILTMKISIRRKIYKPHFSLSLEGLYHVYLAVESVLYTRKNMVIAELGLKCILMNPPPEIMSSKDKPKLLNLVMWCITTSMHLLLQHKKASELKKAAFIGHEDHQNENDLREKVLRWITALVIRGEILSSSISLYNMEMPKAKTLESLLEHLKGRANLNLVTEGDFDILLAMLILYLQQLLGRQFTGLPSVVSAMCLLLGFGLKNSTGNGAMLVDHQLSSLISKLSSHISSPVEANPAWRWSYHQPWRDLSADPTIDDKVTEVQACQSLLLVFSYILSGKVSTFPVLLAELAGSFELVTSDFDHITYRD